MVCIFLYISILDKYGLYIHNVCVCVCNADLYLYLIVALDDLISLHTDSIAISTRIDDKQRTDED